MRAPIQNASASGQLPPRAGATSGPVNVAGAISPTSRPLEYTAVATATLAGNHSRVRVGNAGWLTATPTPMTSVIANSTGSAGPTPRSAEPRPIARRPATSARRAPRRAMSSEPGIAAMASSATGRPVRTETPFSSSPRSRWMAGIKGGTASRVTARARGPSHRSAMYGSSEARRVRGVSSRSRRRRLALASERPTGPAGAGSCRSSGLMASSASI
jgi:hypothetical protein